MKNVVWLVLVVYTLSLDFVSAIATRATNVAPTLRVHFLPPLTAFSKLNIGEPILSFLGLLHVNTTGFDVDHPTLHMKRDTSLVYTHLLQDFLQTRL